MRILIDGRVDGADGIGRYTRSVVAGLRASSSPDVDVAVLRHRTSRRYSRAYGTELLSAAVESDADLIHLFDYRVPVTATTQFAMIVTVHDVLRVIRPNLCYSDAEFAIRFGETALTELREIVADLREIVGFPADRPPVSRHDEFLGRMLALAAHQADRVITPTEAVARQLCGLVSVRDRLLVSPWGIDHLPPVTGVRPTGIPDRYLLYVGQSRPHKGLPALLAAVPRTALYRGGAPLLLAGHDFRSGSPATSVVVRALGSHRVVLLGEVSDSALATLYAHATVLVHLADHEGFGFPPLEALAHGCPVVASDLPVLRETLGPHVAFADPGDPDDVAEQLDLAVAVDGPAKRAARSRWARQFRWQRHVDDLITCYAGILPR